MLPQIAIDGSRPVDVPPPVHFRPLCGVPKHVHWSRNVQTPVRGNSSAQQSGLRYERQAQAFLEEEFGSAYGPSLHFHFDDESGFRTCVPDGVLFIGRHAIVFEIKNQHTPDAWWQLRRLYFPVVSALPEIDHVTLVEVCRTLEPRTPFPEEIVPIISLSSWVAQRHSKIGVFKWRP